MGGAPWFKMYANDLLSDSKIRLLTDDQLGKLVKLWAFACKDGSIPSDLAIASRLLGGCSSEDLAPLLIFFTTSIDDPSQMVSERMMREQVNYSQKCEKLKLNGKKGGEKKQANRVANATANGVAKSTESESESEQDKEVPPKPPKGGEQQKRRRRSQDEILGGYPEKVRQVVNAVLRPGGWVERDPDGREITIDKSQLCVNVDLIFREHPDVDPELLIASKVNYLAKPKMRYCAPQFFFGRGKPGGEPPHWIAEYRMLSHIAAREAGKLPVAV